MARQRCQWDECNNLRLTRKTALEGERERQEADASHHTKDRWAPKEKLEGKVEAGEKV